MKALTLIQPWASLVAVGAKRLETRSWVTNYRGPLAIHASKGFPKWAKELCFQEPFKSTLLGHCVPLRKPPLGAIVATCRLVDCIPTSLLIKRQIGDEEPFGDFNRGRYAWVLADVKILPEPIPAKGQLGLWEWKVPEGVVLQ